MPASSLRTGWRRHRIAVSIPGSGRASLPRGRMAHYTNIADTTSVTVLFKLPKQAASRGYARANRSIKREESEEELEESGPPTIEDMLIGRS
jgi:hypothetical protein